MYKHARGFRGFKPFNFDVKKELEIGIVGHIPPGGVPPPKGKPKNAKPLAKGKPKPMRRAFENPAKAAKAEKIAARLKRRMNGVVVEHKSSKQDSSK